MQFTHSSSNWKRVSRANPCPVCGRADWCLVSGDPAAPDAAICSRVQSPKIVGTKGAGWLHRLRDDDRWRAPRQRTVTVSAPVAPVDMSALADRCEADLGPHRRGLLAAELGVTACSLERLAVGWSAQHRAFTFPMLNSRGHVCGIRLRAVSGNKRSVRGGREGLFAPVNLRESNPLGDDEQPLLICEGPTDCAALLDLGFAAVGRPSCAGGVQHLVGLVCEHQPREVVIVADNDPPGQRGARNLAVALVPYCSCVRTITPPPGIKDMRDWVCDGAERFDVLAAIDRAPALSLRITAREVKR